jgi:hypothetical protein
MRAAKQPPTEGLFFGEGLVDPEAGLGMERGIGLPGGARPAVDGLRDGEGIGLGIGRG